jgi:hypothetical protein
MFAFGSHMSESFHVILHLFCYLLLVGWPLLIAFHLLGLIYGFYKFHRRTLVNNHKELPGISIIKPLTCLDPNLYDNLKTFFNMKYPRYELLFCLQEHNNELIHLIEQLRAQYPHIESQLFVRSRIAEEREDNDDINSSLIISTRRKTIPRWKRILFCGIEKK